MIERTWTARLGEWVAQVTATVLTLPLSILALVTTLMSSIVSAVASITVVGTVVWVVPFGVARWWLRLASRYTGFVGVVQPDDLAHRNGVRPQLRDPRSWRRLLAVGAGLLASVAAGLVALLIVVLAVRLVYYPIAAAGHPDYYRPAWGGPTYLGACAVHMLPCLAVLLIAPRVLHRSHRLQARAWSLGVASASAKSTGPAESVPHTRFLALHNGDRAAH